jgi:hypothetical protein
MPFESDERQNPAWVAVLFAGGSRRPLSNLRESNDAVLNIEILDEIVSKNVAFQSQFFWIRCRCLHEWDFVCTESVRVYPL